MIPQITAQSVHIRMNSINGGIFLSDNEYAYALGLAARKLKLPLDYNLEQFGEAVREVIKTAVPKSKPEKFLFAMIGEYELKEDSNEENTRRMMDMGYEYGAS